MVYFFFYGIRQKINDDSGSRLLGILTFLSVRNGCLIALFPITTSFLRKELLRKTVDNLLRIELQIQALGIEVDRARERWFMKMFFTVFMSIVTTAAVCGLITLILVDSGRKQVFYYVGLLLVSYNWGVLSFLIFGSVLIIYRRVIMMNEALR